MNITSTRVIGTLAGSEIVNCIAIYCEQNYSKILAVGDATAQATNIKNYVKWWLGSNRQLTDAAVNGLNASISWEACVSPIWTMVQAAVGYTGTLAGK